MRNFIAIATAVGASLLLSACNSGNVHGPINNLNTPPLISAAPAASQAAA